MFAEEKLSKIFPRFRTLGAQAERSEAELGLSDPVLNLVVPGGHILHSYTRHFIQLHFSH